MVAFRAALSGFLESTVAPAVAPGADLTVVWAGHGNYLNVPGDTLAAARGGGAYAAFLGVRSVDEVARAAGGHLPNEEHAAMVLALARRSGAARLVWGVHCCYSAPIVAAVGACVAAALQQLLENAEGPPQPPSCLVALVCDRPAVCAQSPVRALGKALYVFDAPFSLPPPSGGDGGDDDGGADDGALAIEAVITTLTDAERLAVASFVALQVERDLRARMFPEWAPAPHEAGDAGALRVAGLAGFREHWPVGSASVAPPGTLKRSLSSWTFDIAVHSGAEAGDARFAAMYTSARGAALASWREARLLAGGSDVTGPVVAAGFARALRTAAAVIDAALATAASSSSSASPAADCRGVAAASAAHTRAAACASPDRVFEELVMAAGVAAAAATEVALAGGVGTVPDPAVAAAGLVGGAAAWAAMARLVDAPSRPRFFARLCAEAAAWAEVTAAGAAARLRGIADIVDALQPQPSPPPPRSPLRDGEGSSAWAGATRQLLAALRIVVNDSGAAIGDSAGGGLELPPAIFAWAEAAAAATAAANAASSSDSSAQVQAFASAPAPAAGAASPPLGDLRALEAGIYARYAAWLLGLHRRQDPAPGGAEGVRLWRREAAEELERCPRPGSSGIVLTFGRGCGT